MHRILLIDDDDDLLSVTKSLLERHNFEVFALSNGKDIDATISTFNPAVILLDISLGNADGRVICREIKTKKESSHVPVLLFSGNTNIRETLPPFLADGFVAKPFSRKELLTSINAVLPGTST